MQPEVNPSKRKERKRSHENIEVIFHHSIHYLQNFHSLVGKTKFTKTIENAFIKILFKVNHKICISMSNIAQKKPRGPQGPWMGNPSVTKNCGVTCITWNIRVYPNSVSKFRAYLNSLFTVTKQFI